MPKNNGNRRRSLVHLVSLDPDPSSEGQPDVSAEAAYRLRESARLEALEPEAEAMGRLARRECEQWYAPPVLFHRMVEDCLGIARTPRTLPEPLDTWAAWGQLLRPSHLRHWLRAVGGKQRIKDALRLRGWR